MLNTILQYNKKEELIAEGDHLLVGVSGGADSVCLLFLLKELREKMEFSMEVIHVEHGIRGEESKKDAAFVEELCRQLSLPFHVYPVRAKEYAMQQKIGLEEAARILRYDCYRKETLAAKEKWKVPIKIALAHHADDNAETVLFQMIRGSGITGLCGMTPKRILFEGAEVIRPLLGITRSQIEEYLKKKEQPYCIDSTNAELIYSRNKIRGEILPALSSINTQAVAHINQSAAMLRELEVYLKIQVENAAQQILIEETESVLILGEPFLKQPEIIRKEVLYLAIIKTAGLTKDIGAGHVQNLLELFALQVGRRISLPYQLSAKRVYEGVRLQKEQVEMEEELFFLGIDGDVLQRELQKGSYTVPVLGGRLVFSLLKTREISKNTYTKCFDYDRMKNSFQIRTRKAGDYLTIDNEGHKKRLKEYFINEKIPKEERDKMLLLTMDSKVIWVIGGRMSADVKVTEQTKNILKVQMIGGKYHESKSSP